MLDPLPGFINDIISKIYQTVSIDSEPASISYASLLNSRLKAKVDEILGGLFFDSGQLKLTPKGSDVAKMYASSRIQTDCLQKVLNIDYSDPYAAYGSTAKCYPTTYMTQMQLHENFVQDVFLDA